MIPNMEGRSPMIEILTNAYPFQMFILIGIIALVPFLLLYDPDDFNKKEDP